MCLIESIRRDCCAGKRHTLPLAQQVLSKLLALPGINAGQAEMISRTVKERCASSTQLAGDTLAAVGAAEGWGPQWNDHTVAALSALISLQPQLSQVFLRPLNIF